MTLFRSLGTLGHIHILRIEGQNGDFSLTGWILTPPSRVDIEGSANYNEICAMTWRVRWHPWLMGDLASSVFPGCVYFPVSPCSVHCGLFPSRSGIVFSSLTTWKMNVSQPGQDSKGRTGAVIKKIKNKEHVDVHACVRPSQVLSVWQKARRRHCSALWRFIKINGVCLASIIMVNMQRRLVH